MLAVSISTNATSASFIVSSNMSSSFASSSPSTTMTSSDGQMSQLAARLSAPTRPQPAGSPQQLRNLLQRPITGPEVTGPVGAGGGAPVSTTKLWVPGIMTDSEMKNEFFRTLIDPKQTLERRQVYVFKCIRIGEQKHLIGVIKKT